MIFTPETFDQIPRGRYGVVYADPPWHHRSYSAKGQARSPSSHYKTMTIEDICAMPVGELAANDCWLVLWTTQPHLEQALRVMHSWGFKYSSIFQFWFKLNPRAASVLFMILSDFHRGMGFTTRKNVEFMILGRRGKAKRQRKDIPDFIIAARRQHSRKPDSVPATVEAFAAGPYLELFGRESRPGWDTYGNEVDKPFTKTANRPPKKRAVKPKPAPAKTTLIKEPA